MLKLEEDWSGSSDNVPPLRRLYVYQPELPENGGYRLIFEDRLPSPPVGVHIRPVQLYLVACEGTSNKKPY